MADAPAGHVWGRGERERDEVPSGYVNIAIENGHL